MKAELAKIAKEMLLIDTLETKHSDFMDFHEVSVWQLRKALEAAYTLGKKDAEMHSMKN